MIIKQVLWLIHAGSYRNQFIDLLSKSMDWFLYDRDLLHERVNSVEAIHWAGIV